MSHFVRVNFFLFIVHLGENVVFLFTLESDCVSNLQWLWLGFGGPHIFACLVHVTLWGFGDSKMVLFDVYDRKERPTNVVA